MSITASTTPVRQAATAGWYPDQQGALRWWDGYRWTNHTQPFHQPASTVVVQQGKTYKTRHAFHLLMSVVTLGLWLPVWLIVGIYNAAKA